MSRFSPDNFFRPAWQSSTETARPQGPGADVSDEASHARMQRLLSGSQAALRHALAFRHMGALHRIALRHSHFNANQPRVPAGNPDGGQWTTADSGRGNDARVMSDATPDNDWKPGRQYATKRRGRGSVPEAEPGQVARLAVAEARAQDAIRRVREVDPNWRPKPSAYGTGIESEIRKANDLAGEAQARIAELGRVGVGPGPFAGESIPARGPSRDFTVQERALIDRIGYSTGCHTCGTRDPGTMWRHFVPDHQPPTARNPLGKPQHLYPHCVACSRNQGLWITRN
jgi:hypothetical protein